MIRILAAVGFALLLTNSALAQAYCDQVKQAVAIYGYAASRQHALDHYGKEAVEAGDKCLRGSTGPRARSKGDRRARSGSSVSAAQDDTTAYGRP